MMECVNIAERLSTESCVKIAVKTIEKQQNDLGLSLVRIAIALHLFREELKLDVLSRGRLQDIGLISAQIHGWLGWEDWGWSQGGYYDLDGCGETSYYFDLSTFNDF